MKLHELENIEAKNRKRIGRGPGSGTGKTAGKGHKGQKPANPSTARAAGLF